MARVAATRPVPIAAVPRTNPFLPAPVPIESFFIDLSPVQKLPTVTPSGFEPLYTSADWIAYRDHFAPMADDKGKAIGTSAFADKLLMAATGPEPSPEMTPGLRRLLILRAAVVAYRGKDGYPTADKAVTAYMGVMDKKSASQVGALWSIANAMARTSVTPKENRLRYDALAARANMQLALLMLDANQIAAADAMIRQVGYHEGWLKKDAATRGQIAQVRAEVKQTGAMMDYLATLYQPALRNDPQALTMVYLFGRFVKGNAGSVANVPGRVPGTALSQLAAGLDTASVERPDAAFAAAEKLRTLAASVPDVLIRARTLYAALQLYDVYLTSPQTEHERVNRTLARIAREGVISDGARRGNLIDPFPPPAPATAPATLPAAVPVIAHAHSAAPSASGAPAGPPMVRAAAGKVFTLPPEPDVAELERSVLRDGHQPWHLDPALAAQAAAAWVAQDDATPQALRGTLMALTEKTPQIANLSPVQSEATWTDAGQRIAVSLVRTKPAPAPGIWMAQRLTMAP